MAEKKENKLFEGKGEGGRWVTINGAHVFVDEGQSIEDAMQTTFNKNPRHDATRAKIAENNKQILENTKNINSKNSWEMSNKNIELYLQNKNLLAEIERTERIRKSVAEKNAGISKYEQDNKRWKEKVQQSAVLASSGDLKTANQVYEEGMKIYYSIPKEFRVD